LPFGFAFATGAAFAAGLAFASGLALPRGCAVPAGDLPAEAVLALRTLPFSPERAVGRVFATNFFFAAMGSLIIPYRHR
jgi:hypothetical protein